MQHKAGLEARQSIPEHPEYIGMYCFLEGNRRMITVGERSVVTQGATMIAPQEAECEMERFWFNMR